MPLEIFAEQDKRSMIEFPRVLSNQEAEFLLVQIMNRGKYDGVSSTFLIEENYFKGARTEEFVYERKASLQ